MGFVNSFTLYDVFLVALGLVTASLIRIFYDSYKEKKRLQDLGQTLKVYNESMDVYEEGVLIITDSNEVVFANKEATRILGVKDGDVDMNHLAKNVDVRLSGSADEDKFAEIISKRKNIPHAYVVVGSSTIPVSINTNKFHMGFDTNDSWRIVIMQDISGKLKLQERLDSIGSFKDLLTNLPTKYHMTSDMVSLIMRGAQKDHDSAIGMFGIRDMDVLKTINGIEKMDLLLRNIAKNISGILKEKETLYRFDCDAYAVLFEDIRDKDEVRRRIESMVAKVHSTLLEMNISAATMKGLYFIEHPSPPAVDVIIDKTYTILRGNSLEQVPSVKNVPAKKDINADKIKAIANKLSKEDFLNAIKNKDFFFFYQPIHDLSDNRVIGVEVLTRLNHKRYGFLMADDFMPKAIEYAIMSEITSHLLDNVLGQKKFWSTEWNVDLDMTINLALMDVQSGIFAEMLEQKLFEYGIDPGSIIIDIPEMVLMQDFESVLEEFYMLNKIGVKLALDHFGEGVTNLKYLERLPLDIIKIDGSIVNGMVSSDNKKRLISGIVSIGNGLNLKVGANHVDSEAVCKELKALGCDFAQGYYFGKAVPAFEITDIIKNNPNILQNHL